MTSSKILSAATLGTGRAQRHAPAPLVAWSGAANSAAPSGFTLGFLAILLPVFGSAALGIANNSTGPMVLAGLVIAFAALTTLLIARRHSAEITAFALTFGVCLSVAAAVQSYAQAMFGKPMTTVDALTYYELFVATGGRDTFETLIDIVNAPLAIVFWQSWYQFALLLGLYNEPYIGIELNAATVALTAAIIVLCGRELYGADPSRLSAITSLCATCGMFWLYGAIFVRDSYSLLFATLTLWALLRWLKRPSSLLQAVFLFLTLLLSAVASYFLRAESIYQFIALIVLAAAVQIYASATLPILRIGVIVVLGIAGLAIMSNTAISKTTSETIIDRQDYYSELGQASSSEGSLGMRLVVSQPMPIRIVVGSLMLILHPMPLWGLISAEMIEYDILKTCHGIFMVWLAPQLATGVLIASRRAMRNLREERALLFLVLYWLATLGGIAITSLETRHHGQFLGASFILAVIPDSTQQYERNLVRRLSIAWWTGLVAIHLAWAALKFG